MKNTALLFRRAWDKALRTAHKARFRSAVRRLHGTGLADAKALDVTVIALVRDGTFYLDGFLDHHPGLGARHFIFCDTGSTDDTLLRLKREPDVTILQARLPIRFESDFRSHAAQTYCRGHWCLFADMDECFTFEGAERVGLPGLTRYLATHGYTAMVAQMLEMFPDAPLARYTHAAYAEVLESYRHYDVSYVELVDYFDPALPMAYFIKDNVLGDRHISFAFGGIRGKVFGERCCLTKHPLVFVDGETQPGIHPHCAGHVRCADLTGLIKHYKFSNNPFERDAASVKASGIGHGEDAQRLERAKDNPDLTLYSQSARAFDGIEALYEAGFLIRSERYSDTLATQP